MSGRPMLDHGETFAAYMPRVADTSLSRAVTLANQINEMKVTDPNTGERINDGLVESLLRNLKNAARTRPEDVAEDPRWSAAQRCVWRHAAPRGNPMPYDKRLEIVNDRRIASEVKAFAHINAARWLVACPFPGCNSAQLASFDDRRYWCVDCANTAVSGKWIEVVWPSDPNAVELALMNRPETAKHWLPGETAEDIAKQDDLAAMDLRGTKPSFQERN